MPITRPIAQSRYARRNLDPALPLFVLRRFAGAHDMATGVQAVYAPGDPFDPKGIDLRRLGFLYRNRFIGHEPPRAMRHGRAAPAPAVAAPVEPPAPAPPAKPAAKPPGRRAGA